jgi:hypothetical protein
MEFQMLTVMPEINTLVDMIGGQWIDDQFLNKLDAIDREVDHFLKEFMNAESFSLESEVILSSFTDRLYCVLQCLALKMLFQSNFFGRVYPLESIKKMNF